MRKTTNMTKSTWLIPTALAGLAVAGAVAVAPVAAAAGVNPEPTPTTPMPVAIAPAFPGGAVALPQGGPVAIFPQDQAIGGADPFLPFGTDPSVPYGAWTP
jgi:hypothetical protein